MKLFISYAREDLTLVRKLYSDLKSISFLLPWLDVEDLKPGQEWEEGILAAIETSNYALIVLSMNSVNKYGYFQKEMRELLERYKYFPPGKIFLIPVRIEECEPKHRELKNLQWIDLFSDWDSGINKIKDVLLCEYGQTTAVDGAATKLKPIEKKQNMGIDTSPIGDETVSITTRATS